MKHIKLSPLFTMLAMACLLIAAIFLFRHGSLFKSAPIFNSTCLAQNTYLGPITPTKGNTQLIRVEVIVNDDPKLGGLQIKEVHFNEINIPLKPRDINGFRGQASFQLTPGKYKLTWVVNRDKFSWPRTVSHEQIVTLDPRDLWVQISIQGEDASIL